MKTTIEQIWLLFTMLYMWGVAMWKKRSKYLRPNMTISWTINYAEKKTDEKLLEAEQSKMARVQEEINGYDEAFRAYSAWPKSNIDFLEMWVRENKGLEKLASLTYAGFIRQSEIDAAVKLFRPRIVENWTRDDINAGPQFPSRESIRIQQHNNLYKIREEMDARVKDAPYEIPEEPTTAVKALANTLSQSDISMMLATDMLMIEFMDRPYGDVLHYKNRTGDEQLRLRKAAICNYIDALEHTMHLAYPARIAVEEIKELRKNEDMV